jgi:hypothetical protein
LNSRRRRRSAVAIVALALTTCLCAAGPAPSFGATSASVEASFAPYRLGARVAGTISVRFSAGAERVPAPLRAMTLRLPAGIGIELSGAAVCEPSRLRSRGTAGCSSASVLGRGGALLKVHAGSQTLPEDAAITVFRGPTRAGWPTFEILGQGETPLDERTISTAVLQGDSAPYGSKLVVSVPPIPTLAYEPNASFSSLSLTIGNAGSSGARIDLPRSCPSSGLAIAASFGFADGSSTTAATRLSCP